MTVVVDHDTGKVIWVSQGHGKSILTKFFKLLTEEQRASIEHVTGDGARWITQCVEEFCPNAIRCIDPFHVVQWQWGQSIQYVARHGRTHERKQRHRRNHCLGDHEKTLLQKIPRHQRSKALDMLLEKLRKI